MRYEWQCKTVKSSGNAMEGQRNGMWSFWRHPGLVNQELPPGWIVDLCWRQFFPSPDSYIRTGASMSPAMTPSEPLNSAAALSSAPSPGWAMNLNRSFVSSLDSGALVLLLLNASRPWFINFAWFGTVDRPCCQYPGLGLPWLLTCTREAAWPQPSPSSYMWKKEWKQSGRES